MTATQPGSTITTDQNINDKPSNANHLNDIDITVPQTTNGMTHTIPDETMLVKPIWIKHHDTGTLLQPSLPIYSIDIHCSNNRIATGGADNKVKIWCMKHILDSSTTSTTPRLLCQLSHHTAAVNALEWSNDGLYLATASDGNKGRSVIIYELSKKSADKQIGSDYIPYENWVIRYSLNAHSMDITDLAWSIDDKLLATCSIDNTIEIYNTNYGTLIKRFKAHNDWVKGICFDPLNRYLASQSTDCLSVWSLQDYSCVKQLERSDDTDIISDKTKAAASRYKNTPISRISFSPDGSIVTATSCHTNGTACSKLYSRSCWAGEYENPVHLIGAAEATTVTRFSPCMYKPYNTTNTNIDHQENIEYFGLIAQGSKDRLITIWRTGTKKPVVLLQNFFAASINDICWSTNGLMLFICSKDGTVLCIQFTAQQLNAVPVSNNEMHHIMKQNNMTTTNNDMNVLTPALLKLQQQNKLQQQQQNKQLFETRLVNNNNSAAGQSIHNKPVTPAPPVKQTEIREPGKKRRVVPVYIPSDDNTSNINNPAQINVVHTQTAALFNDVNASTQYTSTPSQSVNTVSSVPPSVATTVSISSSDTTMSNVADTTQLTELQPILKSKRDNKTSNPSTTHAQQNGSATPNDQSTGSTNNKPNHTVQSNKARYLIDLPQSATKFICHVPTVQHAVSNALHSSMRSPVVEVNVTSMDRLSQIDSRYESTILFTHNRIVQWNDTLYTRATHCSATMNCIVLTGYEGDKHNQHGVMYVYTHAGRQLLPCIMLSAPVTHIHSTMHYVTVVTADAQLHTYSTNPFKLHEQYNFSHLIHKNSQLQSVRLIKDNSNVILSFTHNTSYIYNSDIKQFIRIVDQTNYLSEFHNVLDTRNNNNPSAILNSHDITNNKQITHTIHYIENQLYLSQYLHNIDDMKLWSKIYINKLLSVLPQQKQYFNSTLHTKYLNKINDYCTRLLDDNQLNEYVRTELLPLLSTHPVTQNIVIKLLHSASNATMEP